MAIYVRKERTEILRQALRKLESTTPITASSPGSVARSFAEAITSELGDLYDALDFNTAQSVVSSATGTSLDLLGELYNVRRRSVSELVTLDRATGSFYFYLDAPHNAPITIPAGTKVYTASDSFVGRQLSYATANEVRIPTGKTRAFASIRPEFSTATFTAGPNTLVVHNFTSPAGTVVRCTNPKSIQAQPGYESDDNYRVRIIKSVRVASSGTTEAIRFTALGLSGVRDVRVREAPYGLGSVEVLVTPEATPFSELALRAIRARLEAVRPVGVNLYTRQPTLLPVQVNATVLMATNAASRDREVVEKRANIGVQRYLNSLLVGETLIFNRLIQSIFDSTDGILDVQITRYAPNGVEALRRNFVPKEDEMIIPGAINISRAQ